MARLAAATLAPTWTRWGVDLGPHGGLFRYLYLDVCPPSLQSTEIESVDVAHPVQNVAIPPPPGERLPDWIGELPPLPTAYASLGTVFNHDLGVFRAILEGLAALDVNVILTIGPDNDPADLGPQSPNVHVERYISQELLLPVCDVAVNQGGTAMLPILAHGLPVLVMPQGANQFHNADACVATGVGRRLLPAQVSAESVRNEVATLLSEPSFAENARRVAGEIEAMPGPDQGVRLLEQLADSHRPIRRAGVATPAPEP
jgi:MGT family glycosyltransferase